jgi:hypothetical protein
MLKDFTKEKFDIIIQAGQSNAEGYGFGPASEPYTPCDKVYYLNADLTVSAACEKVRGNEIQTNWGLSFSREYIKAGMLGEGRRLLILRCAVGSTGFSDKRWGMEDDLYLHMMEMIRTALALNGENRLVALLWHQGETDAMKHASFDTHYTNLMTLLQSVRSAFGVPDLPFVAGDFVEEWKNNNIEICTPVVDAIRAVCRDCGNGGFVESDGLQSNNQALSYYPLGWKDTIHFTREAVYELGVRYFHCFSGIVKA